MAAAQRKATRRVTGEKQGEGRPKGGTQAPRGKDAPVAEDVKARDEAARSLDPVTLISGRGGFQLKSGRQLPDGTHEQPWDLTFGRKGFVQADAETLEAVEKVLKGEWSDGPITGRDFQRNARIARLQIVRHGLETPPIPAWDDLASDSRVDVALAAGALRTPDAIAKAIRYEKQSPQRMIAGGGARDQDEVTLAKLEALLGAQRTGVKVQGVDAGVAASAGGSILTAGATEL